MHALLAVISNSPHALATLVDIPAAFRISALDFVPLAGRIVSAFTLCYLQFSDGLAAPDGGHARVFSPSTGAFVQFQAMAKSVSLCQTQSHGSTPWTLPLDNMKIRQSRHTRSRNSFFF